MAIFVSFLVAVLFGSGIYLMMRRHIFEVLLGSLLLSHGINLFLLSMGGWRPEEVPPILIPGKELAASAYADPVPQALILTAIVIGFGVTAFLVVLVLRGYENTGDPEFGEKGREEDEP